MDASQKKQLILNAIYERAQELEEKAIETLLLCTNAKQIDYGALSESALKRAFQEFKENKPVFKISNLK